MDQPLRCNNQLDGCCRKPLTDVAVVTTCSHILCLDCAEKTQFATAPYHSRVCPVCRAPLPQRDDAIRTQLVPTEDYKTSVLSGLDPATIMDCASRALAFWTYQTVQEIFYQEHLGKMLKEKYTQLSTAMDKVIHEANTEISALQDKMKNVGLEQDKLQTKYDDLANAYREKSKKAAQSQQLYDALKKKVLLRSVQPAASADVNQTLQSIAEHSRPQNEQMHYPPEHQHHMESHSDRGRKGPEHPDLLGTDLRPMGYTAQRISDSGRYGDNMAPPARPIANRLGQGGGSLGTPVQRTTLPSVGRATTNRSQIPISVGRQDHRPLQGMHGYGSGTRYNTAMGEDPRAGASTPRGFGMLEGMKIGRPGTVGGNYTQPRFTRASAFL